MGYQMNVGSTAIIVTGEKSIEERDPFIVSLRNAAEECRVLITKSLSVH